MNQSQSSTRSKLPIFVSVVLLAALLALLGFAFQGARGIWQPDEGYYVGTTVTMLQEGDLLIPRLGEAIFLEKPPLTYWGVMAGLRILGHNEFGARAFNAVCYIATALTVGLLAFSLFARALDAIIASLVYATMVIPFMAANFVTPDTPLVLWTTIAALFFWKSAQPNGRRRYLWQLLLCAAVGMGFLSKGPAALVPCGGLFLFLVLTRRGIKYFATPWAIVGFLIFCVLGLGWYFYVALKVPDAASYFIDNQIWGRLVSPKYNRNPGIAGALIYLPVLAFGSLPWSAIWWDHREKIKTTLFKKTWWTDLRHRPVPLFLLAWFFAPLLLLCLASSKLGLYALPIFPPLTLATSRLWANKIRLALSSSQQKTAWFYARPTALIGCWILLILAAKLALAHYPTRKDASALWQEIQRHIPDGDYEIVTLDEHADGLLFYGAMEVENVTRKDEPYPTFTLPEKILHEIKYIPIDNHPFLFIVNDDKDMATIESVLSQEAIDFQKIPLNYGRFLLLTNAPAGKLGGSSPG